MSYATDYDEHDIHPLESENDKLRATIESLEDKVEAMFDTEADLVDAIKGLLRNGGMVDKGGAEEMEYWDAARHAVANAGGAS